MRVTILILAATLSAGAFVEAAPPSLLEATADGKAYRGKLVGRDDKVCWLMGRDGRLTKLDIEKISKIEVASPAFRAHTGAELRDLVRREYGKDFDVVASGNYVICAPPLQAARYAELFDGMYRTVHLYFSRRGFRLQEPEFPLVAVVFPNRAAFAKQCERDGVRSGAGLLGYYHPDTNRVVLFDPGEATQPAKKSTSIPDSPLAQKNLFAANRDAGLVDLHDDRMFGRQPAGEIEADLQATIVHEATHQVAFNIGLHSRVGKNPRWVVEGLATALEVPSMYDNSAADSQKERMNRDRYVWFMNFASARRKPNSIADFVATDRLFQTSILDGYAQGWALTFFLLETRPSKYAAYLRVIAARDPLAEYPPEERLADFCSIFGRKIEQFDAEFLRFFERLK